MTHSTVTTSPPADAGTKTIRVFLMDDHELVRRGLVDLLKSEPDITVVGEAGTAADALRRIPGARPDVALLDGRLPDGSGIDVCREVRSSNPDIRCVILTSFDDDEALFSAIMAGASGYLLKEVGGSNLVAGIRQVAAGHSLIDPAVTQKLLDRLRNPVKESSKLDQLTPREREILDLITDGFTNRQIGDTLFLAEKTVKNYVSILLTKLGMQRRTQAAVYGSQLRNGRGPAVSGS
ncbi:DNA-binding response regulator, NarL/FixJ family, contains REC and HTH domains [Friedmanniella luteola]|uniref:DNA-binding response regulator, NarL/FixJ family, contains REC and HTH domains n=1 Tax=Friedmanniella luteola TaxID=546871 RepID=A0A1H1PQH0_9ACTN|nr:DNA-binding response regulator, NarL/FixJ family, contains REC and HTH domains [Friedmanniella luteola]